MKLKRFFLAPALLAGAASIAACSQTSEVRGPLIISGPVSDRMLDELDIANAGVCSSVSVGSRKDGCD